ncbi:hypothetical protein ACWPKS_10015 [Coraliomargarita sp. W4R72]
MEIMEWVSANKEWLFSGVGVSFLGILYALMQKKASNTGESSSVATNAIAQNSVNIFNERPLKAEPVEDEEEEVDGDCLQVLKDNTRILFIDDDDKFKVVKILKNSGWIHTSLIKDVQNLDQTNISQAKLLFVDIQGVGKRLAFADEGLGLAKALKQKYPHKYVIIYSSQTEGDRFHEALRLADDSLEKNADPYQFQQLVEKFARKANR